MNYKRELNQILEYEKTNMNGYAKQWLTAITKKPYICLWGAGNHGKNWYRYLTELQIKVDFIGDNFKEALTKWDLLGGQALNDRGIDTTSQSTDHHYRGTSI